MRGQRVYRHVRKTQSSYILLSSPVPLLPSFLSFIPVTLAPFPFHPPSLRSPFPSSFPLSPLLLLLLLRFPPPLVHKLSGGIRSLNNFPETEIFSEPVLVGEECLHGNTSWR